jgi:4-amino-4-deoxy-L-arabinose transferase-like glycosyltransferase
VTATAPARAAPRGRARPRPLAAVRAWPEVLVLVALTAVLNLAELSRNGWANTFYTGAVRSMAWSWHDFLYGSLDRAGLMTVDKSPAALWVQALSVRIFGFHPLAILVPEALMGIAATVLIYDIARRVFGRGAGVAAGLVMTLTPITVAISRHNNPDALLILCCVAAMWCAVRALQDGRTRWLVWCGALIGLGFEAKMSVALFVVPGIACAYLWVAPAGRGRWHALGQLLLAGLVLAGVTLAWPLLVAFTPAADRPWISGTSDNSIWSLILGYNGVGRVAGQAGSTLGGGGGAGGGAVGPLRLLDSALGGQAGWLVGFALAAGIGVLACARGRRADARTGWVLAVGGAFVVSALVFSVASGIFHPYYVSFLAPWTALLVGAGVGEALSGRRSGQIVGVVAIAAGAITELIVLGNVDGSVPWARPLVLAVGTACVLALALRLSKRARAAVVAVAIAALLAAPAAWAVDTLGYATSSTFPAGGPENATSLGGGGFAGGPGGGFGGAPGGRGFAGARGGGPFGGRGPGAHVTGHFFGAGGSGMFGADTTSLSAAAKYAANHGGGTVAVESQSSAAEAIINGERNVAGIGGFSGVESTVSVTWLAMEVRDGKLRWILSEATTGAPGADGRTGSEKAVAIAEQAGRKVTFTSGGQTITLYDLKGRAAQILAAAR